MRGPTKAINIQRKSVNIIVRLTATLVYRPSFLHRTRSQVDSQAFPLHTRQPVCSCPPLQSCVLGRAPTAAFSHHEVSAAAAGSSPDFSHHCVVSRWSGNTKKRQEYKDDVEPFEYSDKRVSLWLSSQVP